MKKNNKSRKISIKNSSEMSFSGNSVFTGNMILEPVEQYKMKLGSKASIRTVDVRLNVCAKIWGCSDYTQIVWGRLTKAHVLGVIKTLENQGKKNSTIKNTLSCLKGAVREAYDLDMMDGDNYFKITNIKAPKGYQEETGTALEGLQMKSLLKHIKCLTSSIGIRDNAILVVLLSTGLRRAEITGIRMVDIDFNGRVILIKGKGNKERKVGISDSVYDALMKWMNVISDQNGEYLFSRVRKNGKIDSKNKLSDQAIYDIVKFRCSEVGVNRIAPHDLRRSFATHMLKQGVDMLNVMKMMGHSSPETTKRYDKSGQNQALDIMRNMKY